MILIKVDLMGRKSPASYIVRNTVTSGYILYEKKNPVITVYNYIVGLYSPLSVGIGLESCGDHSPYYVQLNSASISAITTLYKHPSKYVSIYRSVKNFPCLYTLLHFSYTSQIKQGVHY